METKQCFEQGCTLEVECVCQCTSPETYSCQMHLWKHLKLPNRNHSFDSIYLEPCEDTKEAILGFLAKENSKYSELKSKIITSFSQHLLNTENDFEELLKNIDSSSSEINNYLAKISQAEKLYKSEQEPILRLLSLQPDEAVEKLKTIIPDNSNWCIAANQFLGINSKIEKMIECFIKDKFEGYLNRRLSNIENTLEKHNKIIGLAANEPEDSISEIVNSNKKSISELECLKKEIEVKREENLAMLNCQIASATEDTNRKLKEIESQNDILTLQELLDKTTEILNRANDPELEITFRNTCLKYKSNPSIYDPQIIQAYHNYLNTYHQNTSLYSIFTAEKKTNLVVYNTENDIKVSKVLNTTLAFSSSSCITQIPNGIFCFGDNPPSGATLVIDWNCEILVLPSGTPCILSSAVYFNNNVYCFGGRYQNKSLTLSSRFDLLENQWIELAPIPEADDGCSSIVLKGRILISRYYNRNLISYWIDSNSFTTLPYQFAEKTKKILINADRIYLIECKKGSIYESEVDDETTWRQIGVSNISLGCGQVYCLYNKGAVYISIDNYHYNFNLSDKSLTLLHR